MASTTTQAIGGPAIGGPATGGSATGAAHPPPAAAKAARRAGEEFEAMFIGRMIAHMFEGVGDDPLMGGGQAGQLYRSMLREEFGRTIARAGGIGIADAVTRELIEAQEGRS